MKVAGLAFAIAALTAGSAVAQSPMPMPNVQPFSGYVEGYGGHAWWPYLSDGSNGFGGAGRFSWEFAPGWSVQGDVFGSHFENSSNHNFDYGDFGGVVHLSKRAPTHLIGAFVGFAGIENYYDPGLGVLIYGGEGQLHAGNMTLYGQVGGMSSTGSGVVGFSYAFGRAVIRYFCSPNTKIEGGVTVLSGNPYTYSPSYADTTTVWNLKLEHQFQGGPLSAFVSADTATSSWVKSGWPSGTVSRITGGLKLSLGTGTLRDTNQGGATLDEPDLSILGFIRNGTI